MLKLHVSSPIFSSYTSLGTSSATQPSMNFFPGFNADLDRSCSHFPLTNNRSLLTRLRSSTSSQMCVSLHFLLLSHAVHPTWGCSQPRPCSFMCPFAVSFRQINLLGSSDAILALISQRLGWIIPPAHSPSSSSPSSATPTNFGDPISSASVAPSLGDAPASAEPVRVGERCVDNLPYHDLTVHEKLSQLIVFLAHMVV
jgi:hypothetical protein